MKENKGVKRLAIRDDFSKGVREVLAHRAGFRCSKPDCRASTAGPSSVNNKHGSIGIAAHIAWIASGFRIRGDTQFRFFGFNPPSCECTTSPASCGRVIYFPRILLTTINVFPILNPYFFTSQGCTIVFRSVLHGSRGRFCGSFGTFIF
jgi:hypothetical protein